MNAGVLIPLACFGAVVIIVALVSFGRIYDREIEAHHRAYAGEREHRQAMERLDEELRRLREKKGGEWN